MSAFSDRETEENNQDEQQPVASRRSSGGTAAKWILNGLIIVLLPLLGFSAYLYFSPKAVDVPTQQAPSTMSQHEQIAPAGGPPAAGQQQQAPAKPAKVIQLDVLNGCGARGAGNSMTNFLRSNGFDVVEMKNYKTFHVQQTLVVDRIGDLAAAKRVAAALGVNEKNVIQQINADYFVDVSVIIGKDYTDLIGSSKK